VIELPRVRSNLRYIRQEKDGKAFYVVKDPVTLKYYRFGQLEAWLMQHLDGTRTAEDVAALLKEEVGVSTKAASVEAFVRRLRELGLADRGREERSAMLMEQVRRQRRVRLENNSNTLMRMRFSFGDPDHLLGRITAATPFFWKPPFVGASAVLFTAYLLLLAAYWTPFTKGLASLYDPASYTLAFFVGMYVLSVVIFIIHEFGHGLTCKRFGGEVHEMGAMLLYFSPAFFCNVNDAWTFEKRSHRLWVTFAGGWIQLCLAAIAAGVWVLTEPGTLVNRTAFLTTLISGGFSVLVNYNPLIPLDGYYALVDWLDIPNLRARAFNYLGAVLKHSVLRLDVPLPPATPRERRVFLIYGSLSVLYTITIITVILKWFGGLLVGWFGGWGWFIVALIVARIIGKLRGPVVSMTRLWAAEKLPRGQRSRAFLAAGGALALLMLLALIVPWTVKVPAVATLEPTSRVLLGATEPARLVDVRAREGQLLQPGDTVLVLRASQLELDWREAGAAVRRLAGERAAALARGDATEARALALTREAALARHRALDVRREALVLRAPFAARLATPHLEEAIGAEFVETDTIAELWGEGTLRARLALSQRDAGDVTEGTPVGIRFSTFPRWTWRARVAHVAPAEHDGELIALAPVGASADAPPLRAGMTGRARLAVTHTSVAGALARTALRIIRLDLLP
jgi:putative peptide zinc metalloprotease protein